MQAYGKRGKDAHFPHRSGAVTFKAGVFLLSRRSGRASGRRGASERESSGLQRGLDNGEIRSLEVGWPSNVARRHRRSGVALGKLHKLPLDQGAGRSERDSQWKRAWQAAVKCSKSISPLPQQAAQAWRCHW